MTEDLCIKRDRLLDILRGFGTCAVAFSGGMDSTVLAKAAQLALGDQAIAITGVSESMPSGETDDCRRLAEEIGIRHEVVETRELDNPDYQRNDAVRCYHCRNVLFGQFEELCRAADISIICDGANRDDEQEHRPGRRAARDRNVRSPLAESDLTKDEIRQLARHWDLPVWNKPPMPCLSSRIAYGETVTAERLAMVDRGEQFLRERGFSPLRVRYHRGDIARIEVAPEAIARFAEVAFREEVIQALGAIGFRYVSLDLEGFRSGSLNAVLPIESLETGR